MIDSLTPFCEMPTWYKWGSIIGINIVTGISFYVIGKQEKRRRKKIIKC